MQQTVHHQHWCMLIVALQSSAWHYQLSSNAIHLKFTARHPSACWRLCFKLKLLTSNCFKELHILKFPDINFLHTALFMFKVNRNLLPSHLIKSFYQNSEIHHYCTRSSDNYHLESVNTNIKRFSILPSVGKRTQLQKSQFWEKQQKQ